MHKPDVLLLDSGCSIHHTWFEAGWIVRSRQDPRLVHIIRFGVPAFAQGYGGQAAFFSSSFVRWALNDLYRWPPSCYFPRLAMEFAFLPLKENRLVS